jgi:dGTP triphosphohydrolase
MLVKEESARVVVAKFYNFYRKNYDLVLKEMPFLEGEDIERGTCDYVAFLTDLKAQELYRKHRLDR